MRVAIYGGSFDPPHIGHLAVIEEAIKSLDIDKLIVLPNYLNPWKDSTMFSPEDRLKLLEKLVTKMDKVEVSSFEIDNGYPTKSIESIRHFSKLYDKIYLIIGADNLAKLHLWDEFDEIERRVEFVIALRNGINIPDKYIILNTDVQISSTELRNSLDITKVPKEIANYLL